MRVINASQFHLPVEDASGNLLYKVLGSYLPEFINLEGDDSTFRVYAEGDDDIIIMDTSFTVSQKPSHLIFGHDGDDIVVGSNVDDSIYGGDGNDYIFANDGSDFIYSGDGSDYIDAGPGDDEVVARNSDYIIAGLGNDKLIVDKYTIESKLDGGDGYDSVVFDYALESVTNYQTFDNAIKLNTNIFINVESFSFNGETLNLNELDVALLGVKTEPDNELTSFFNKENLITPLSDESNSIIGTAGIDILKLPDSLSSLLGFNYKVDGGIEVVTKDAVFKTYEIEKLSFDNISSISILTLGDYYELDVPLYTGYSNGKTFNISPTNYEGAVDFLEYQLFGDVNNNIVSGSGFNDFLNLLDGDDAANGGDGDDVLDGGTGSNFLTGGAGKDTFFLDGRGGTITWSTITDFLDDTVNIWGWNEGTSTLLLQEISAGAEGFKGITFHYDLDGDQIIDTSITFSGLNSFNSTNIQEKEISGNGYLLFI